MTERYEEGALLVGDGITLPYLWTSLHLNSRMEQKLIERPRFEREAERFSGELSFLLEMLSDVEAERWLALCEAAGMTIFGVVGLSWCRGTSRALLWSAWDECEYDLTADRSAERPIQFLNSAIMPKAITLSEIAELCGGDGHRICLVIAAQTETAVVVDADVGQIATTNVVELRDYLDKRSVSGSKEPV